MTLFQGQIFIDMDELKDGRPLHDYILQFLAEHDITGATSFKGYTGFGRNHKIKKPNDFFSFDEPPMQIIFIDKESKVRETISALRQEVSNALITIHPVETL